MICKWCGNSMETRETVCRRCGKEVPAKSDCGGFYDLVPDAQGIVPPVLLQPSTQKKTAKKSGLAVFLGLLCCILVVVTVVTAVSGNSAKKEAARLEEQLRVATEYEEVLLNQQKFKTVLRLDENKEEETYSMKVDSDLPGSVVVKCTPTGKKGIVGYSTELVVPNEKNGVVKLQLDQDPKKEELTLQMELGKTFGRLDNVGCTLFYVAEDGSLVKLEKEPPAEDSKTTEEEPKPTEEDVKEQEAEKEAEEDGINNPFADLTAGQEGDQQPDAPESETNPTGEEPTAPQQVSEGEKPEAAEDMVEITEEDVVILRLPYAYIKEMAKGNPQLTADTEYVCRLVWKNKQGGSFTVVVEGITVP